MQDQEWCQCGKKKKRSFFFLKTCSTNSTVVHPMSVQQSDYVIVLPAFVVISMELNRKHYFSSMPYIFKITFVIEDFLFPTVLLTFVMVSMEINRHYFWSISHISKIPFVAENLLYPTMLLNLT